MIYCEIIINRGILFFVDLIKIQRNTIFPLIVVCNCWKIRFQEPMEQWKPWKFVLTNKITFTVFL